MKRTEYIKFTQTGKSKGKKPLISGPSVTDPTFARTGRQMIFQPLNIEYRMKYPEGNPLNPDNPMHFNEFDKIYPDQFKAMREAKRQISTTKSKLNEIQNKSQNLNKQEPTNP